MKCHHRGSEFLNSGPMPLKLHPLAAVRNLGPSMHRCRSVVESLASRWVFANGGLKSVKLMCFVSPESGFCLAGK
ncbi:hypothetical protein L484_014816 [Morus notabilis]|uniref:Uncharacterized protein n=1 Tax=Morus notabilis TaxID=981085 RepID=W9QEX9_9ROSA|nr:hypothetical protein L484_014816 [Morus notabilis]